MANVPYSPVPSVEPQVQRGNDTERIDASPSAFGAAIGQGAEQFGQGALNASQFWGQIQTDGALNNGLKEGDKVVENYKSLRGQNALDAQDTTNKQLDDIGAQYRQQLKTPEQQLEFDRQWRPYRDRYWAGQMSSHADQQGYVHASAVNKDGLTLATSQAATAASYPDPAKAADEIENAKHNARSFVVKQLTLDGQDRDPEAMKAGLQRADTAVYKTVVETLRATDPVRAQKFLEQHKDDLGAEYAPLAEQVKAAAQRADVHAGVSEIVAKNFHASTTALAANGQNNYGPVFSRYNQLLNSGDVQGALRLSEGLRTEPYWDVNHLRTGYGSDTVTRADGSVEVVNASTRITPADAERDLRRRTDLAAQSAASTVGEAWRGMSQGQHAALTSVVYNYGHLPDNIAAAARSGDKQALASAIVAHAGDNNGVNAQRRRAEAGAVLGGGAIAPASYTVTSLSADRAAEQARNLDAGSDAGATVPSGTPSPTPASFTPGEPPAPPSPPPPAPETPEEKLDRLTMAKDQSVADAWMHPGWSYEQKIQAEREISATFTAAAIAAQQDAKTLKVKKDAVVDKMYGYINSGQPDQAFQLIRDPTNGLDEKERFTLAKTLEQASGQADPATLGPKYHDYLSRVVAQPGSPERLGIGDTVKLYEAVNNHELTLRGAQELSKVINSVQKSTDEYGNQIMMNTALGRAKDKLIHEEDIGSFHVRDPNGLTAYENFTNKIIGEFNNYREKGYDPKGFKYFDPGEADKLMDQIYPERERILDRLKASGQAPQEEAGQAAPAGLDPKAWSVVMSAPPVLEHNRIMPQQDWAPAVQALLADPTEKNIGYFNKLFRGADGSNDGATIVQALGGRAAVATPASGPSGPSIPQPPERPSETMEHVDWRSRETTPTREVPQEEEKRKMQAVDRANVIMAPPHLEPEPKPLKEDWRSRAMKEP